MKKCKPKKAQTRSGRTGGIYATVSGSSQDKNFALEVRELLGSENNVEKEKSLKALASKCENLELWVRDSVCGCEFADKYVKRRMIDRFHSKNHVRELCRAKYNPDWAANARVRKKLKCDNTVAAEQLFRPCNRHTAALSMTKCNYGAYWRHFFKNYSRNRIFSSNSFIFGRGVLILRER